MTTIKDVAQKAGVSVATVSRVVNNGPKVSKKTIAHVKQVMTELGYTPNANARALVTQKSSTVGVVIPELTDPFFASLAGGVEQVARAYKRQLLLSTGQISADAELKAIQLLIERQCDVIVVHSKFLDDDTLINLSQQIKGLVIIDRFIPAIAQRCVWLDNQEGGKTAARHFVTLGHQSFACISSNYQIEDPSLRLNGFRQGLESANFNLIAELTSFSEPTLRGGELATQKLLASNHQFSALFVYNDAMAIGAISTLEDNGFRVPQDISVIGFDDVLLSRYSRPKLTTMHYPIEQMAQQAAELAIALATNSHETINSQGIKHVPRLVKRESTASYTTI
ncbi:LacI family DNA-binding transcriptional regulator [Thalassotalea marina]|uniref:Transcriptional regulator n=1 Tax=Thalassotalea marina TaxID=1673741 RepID=A0A919BMJ8_9GAMM|nr:LacI family DNA-binding transcriptional regulator [Thalassotalea marina]GHF99509.1 transcriptional regulator [Thalassotalea marina]